MPLERKLLEATEKFYPTQVRFEPDGARVLVLGTNGRLTVVPRDGGKSKSAASSGGALVVSNDGALIATGESTVSVLDARTLKKVWGVKATYATSAAFSPDGALLAFGSVQTGIALHDARSGDRLPVRLQTTPGAVHDLAFSVDGTALFAVGALGYVDRFDTTTWERTNTPREPSLDAVALSSDGKLIATGGAAWPVVDHPVAGKTPSSTHVTVRAPDLSLLRTLHVGDENAVESPMGVIGNVRSVRFVPGTSELCALFRRIDATFLHRWDATDGRVLATERLPVTGHDLDVAADRTIAIAAREGLFLWS